MRRRNGRLTAALLGTLLGLVGSGAAVGQDTVGMGTTNGLPPGYATNPYTSPALNPWLSPYARQGVMSPEQMSLTFLAARQQRLVARKERAEALEREAARRPEPAQAVNPMMRPGGTVSGAYFGRGRAAAEAVGPTAGRGGGYFGRGRR